MILKAEGDPSPDFYLYKSNEWLLYFFIAVYVSLFLLVVGLTAAHYIHRANRRRAFLRNTFRLIVSTNSENRRMDDIKLTDSTKLKSTHPKSFSSMKGSLYAPNRLELGPSEVFNQRMAQ